MLRHFLSFLVQLTICIYLGCVCVYAQNVTCSFPALYVTQLRIRETIIISNMRELEAIGFRMVVISPLIRQPEGFATGNSFVIFLACKLKIKESVPAFLDPNIKIEDLLTGYDNLTIAFGGSIPIWQQLVYMSKCFQRIESEPRNAKLHRTKSQALYLISMGSNDFQVTYFNMPFRRLMYDLPTYIHLMVQASLDLVKDLYKLGARNIIVMGLPPLGCLPIQRTLGGDPFRRCDERLNVAAYLHGSLLIREIGILMPKLPGSKIMYFDLYYIVLDMITDKEKYGFTDASLGCCGTGTFEVSILCNKLSCSCPDPSKYIFWDSTHTTEKANHIISKQLVKDVISTFGSR
ncbi:hypothetical protein GIB67_030823 [Kingdonia uniflora]|uniref:Uncharacterized protein n=1 Tax=Kingdonia uniflora TaxID=39325 RepID=A0A7J7L3A3_9MAGN|nr:hypothetical protein GIB67_030823 [Kingdonia uniflora]